MMQFPPLPFSGSFYVFCKNVLCNIITNIAKIMKTDAFQCSALAFAIDFVFIKILKSLYTVLALHNSILICLMHDVSKNYS